MDSLLKEERGMAVPEVVKPDARHVGSFRDTRQIALGYVVRVQRFPVGLAEDQAVVFVTLPWSS